MESPFILHNHYRFRVEERHTEYTYRMDVQDTLTEVAVQLLNGPRKLTPGYLTVFSQAKTTKEMIMKMILFLKGSISPAQEVVLSAEVKRLYALMDDRRAEYGPILMPIIPASGKDTVIEILFQLFIEKTNHRYDQASASFAYFIYLLSGSDDDMDLMANSVFSKIYTSVDACRLIFAHTEALQTELSAPTSSQFNINFSEDVAEIERRMRRLNSIARKYIDLEKATALVAQFEPRCIHSNSQETLPWNFFGTQFVSLESIGPIVFGAQIWKYITPHLSKTKDQSVMLNHLMLLICAKRDIADMREKIEYLEANTDYLRESLGKAEGNVSKHFRANKALLRENEQAERTRDDAETRFQKAAIGSQEEGRQLRRLERASDKLQDMADDMDEYVEKHDRLRKRVHDLNKAISGNRRRVVQLQNDIDDTKNAVSMANEYLKNIGVVIDNKLLVSAPRLSTTLKQQWQVSWACGAAFADKYPLAAKVLDLISYAMFKHRDRYRMRVPQLIVLRMISCLQEGDTAPAPFSCRMWHPVSQDKNVGHILRLAYPDVMGYSSIEFPNAYQITSYEKFVKVCMVLYSFSSGYCRSTKLIFDALLYNGTEFEATVLKIAGELLFHVRQASVSFLTAMKTLGVTISGIEPEAFGIRNMDDVQKLLELYPFNEKFLPGDGYRVCLCRRWIGVYFKIWMLKARDRTKNLEQHMESQFRNQLQALANMSVFGFPDLVIPDDESYCSQKLREGQIPVPGPPPEYMIPEDQNSRLQLALYSAGGIIYGHSPDNYYTHICKLWSDIQKRPSMEVETKFSKPNIKATAISLWPYQLE